MPQKNNHQYEVELGFTWLYLAKSMLSDPYQPKHILFTTKTKHSQIKTPLPSREPNWEDIHARPHASADQRSGKSLSLHLLEVPRFAVLVIFAKPSAQGGVAAVKMAMRWRTPGRVYRSGRTCRNNKQKSLSQLPGMFCFMGACLPACLPGVRACCLDKIWQIWV